MEILKQRHDVLTFIHNVAEEQRMPKYTITDVTTNEKGEGYLGQVFMITLKNDSNNKQLCLVVKVAFIDEKARKFVPIKQSFLNEIYIYEHMIPMFRKLETNHGTPHSELFPQCLKVLSENNNEMLCLENLKSFNFEIFDKRSILDDEHLSFIFKTYGRFHGYSFVLKDQQPEEYKRLTSGMYNIYEEFVINPNGNFGKYLEGIMDDVRKCLVPGDDDAIIRKFEKYGEGILDCFHGLVTDVCDYSCILHGDCWSNNMMFKYETFQNSRKLVDMRLLDLQIVKVGSPACDLSYCLYSGGSKTLYDNLEKYVKIYQESLSATLKDFGIAAQEVFPSHVLNEHWKKYARFGMIMAFCNIKVKCTKAEDIVDLTGDFDTTEPAKTKFNEEEFGKRAKEILYHLSKIDAL